LKSENAQRPVLSIFQSKEGIANPTFALFNLTTPKKLDRNLLIVYNLVRLKNINFKEKERRKQ
jgi:hypothetical protein